MSKVMSLNEAIGLIRDGDRVATSGICMSGVPEEIMAGIEKSFLETGKPRDLNMIFAAGQGCWDDIHAYQHMAHEGLVASAIGGHFGTCKSFGKLIEDNKIIGYNMPQGVIVDLFHEAVKGMPGHITKLGLKTFVDPRIEGGKLNARTTEDIVKVIEIDGEEYLMYKTPKIDVALIRGTSADAYGNISFEEEALPVDMRLIAMAAKACGGKVIVQVKYSCERLMTDKVVIPGIFVDAVVVSEEPEKNHRQTQLHFYDPSLSGRVFVAQDAIASLPLNAKKVISRRAAMELTRGAVINLGVGTPEGIANIAAEEGVSDLITMTSESGAVAGVPLGGKAFGSVQNAWAIVEQEVQFDFYDGGGLDVSYLGLAEADRVGNVNVSHFGTNVTGCGGFINISQTTQNLVYCGTFTAGAQNGIMSIANTAAVVGFGSIVTATPAFGTLAEIVQDFAQNGNAYTAVAISVAALAGISGSASGGLGIAIPIAADIFLPMGINPEALHRIAVISSSALDSLPHNGFVNTCLQYTHTNHKEAYFDIFIVSVAVTIVETILVVILFSVMG